MILPDLDELLALRGAAQGLKLGARRAALAQLQGGHRSAQRGRGLEVEEVRPYAAGDDARSIDWRVTARRGRLHTKLYREDRERPVWLLADLHAGLFFGSRRQLKSALLLRTAAMLGWAAVNGGDRLGAVLADGQTEPLILPPRARQAGVLPFLEALVERQPRAPGRAAADSLQRALQTVQPLLRPGSMLLLLSDFSGLDEHGEMQLASAAARCDCRLLWLSDPLESSGLPRGQYRLGLPGRLWWLDGERSRDAWQSVWREREHRLEAVTRRLGLPLARLTTADPVTVTLPRLLREAA
ncbi:DUF58 domain-containing protein [Solimonas terrae]|uniref:DUF58 domain-containing protein n=1 Tax=Solimonas terrae TaxID=1396819 RepID=A0A6M2BXA5_9GAMM|nr:DUF58 domain-containing protein [Solimonas terrae]NGY06811.1 DUF58 domain-containing protein [Solimonas terrae]